MTRPPALPDSLLRLLQQHAVAHAPHYPPVDNSDHGPMAYLAMHGLGIDVKDIEAFARSYRKKLAPAPPPDVVVGADTWQTWVGRRDAYSSLRSFFLDRIRAEGWQNVVARTLPTLISGWVQDAFHPLIRLGYGIEFEAEAEIAAGLAYLTITGDDPRLAELAARPSAAAGGREYLESVQALRDSTYTRGPFNARYRRIVDTAAVRPAAGNAGASLERLSRACLEVFHATHDFFALHLVTASHAFRICSGWAGPAAEGLFSVGIAAAYLAIGAPRFEAVETSDAELPIKSLARATDEHDIKLAYSCRAQAEAYADPTYRAVAHAYLLPRLRGTVS